MYRLTQGTGPYGQIDYGYDATGNRLNKTRTDTQSTLTETYTYQATTNRLDGIAFNDGSATTQRSLTYDAVGNIVTDIRNGQTYNYIYNHANRRQSVTDGAQNPTTLATYVYNAFGERVVKSTGGTTQHAHYLDGLRLSETDQNGNAITEYIYLAGTPIAVIKNANQAIPAEDKLYYIVPDHLATPRVVLDQDQQIVWRQNATPFGIVDIDEDPDGDSNAFKLDARFPGQFWDQETQSSYNYFRDYDQGIGRYLQSDPIGLLAGPNTYAYVNSNPVSRFDPLGLLDIFIGGGGDNTSGIVKNYQKQFAQSYPNRTSMYFQWGQQKAIIQAIQAALKNDPCTPINLIGHSYGGATAANTAKALSKQGINSANVFTIDPVSRIWSRSGVGNSNYWVNVLATNSAPGGGRGNFIASIGGKWGNWPNGKANVFYTAPYNHAQFSQMFSYTPPGGQSALQSVLNINTGCSCQSP